MNKTKILLVAASLTVFTATFAGFVGIEIFQRQIVRDNSPSLSCIGEVICVDTGNAVLLDDGTVVTRTVPSNGRKPIKTLPYTISEWNEMTDESQNEIDERDN